MWRDASKNNKKNLQCPFCDQNVGDMTVYEKYGLLGSVPLFGLPLVYENMQTAYIMFFVVMGYMTVLFYGLYILVPFNCRKSSLPIDKQKEKFNDEDEKNNLVAVLLIIFVFFVSIFAIFMPLFSR